MPTEDEAATDAATVTVRRVHHGRVYARVSTVGAPGDRACVLVPGIGAASTFYERLAPLLRDLGPVHALDLPGFGGVPAGRRALDIEDYADVLDAVLDDIRERDGIDDPVLIGHSMGTQVVVEVAARRPGISTAVLIGPVVAPGLRRIPRLLWAFARSSTREPLKIAGLAVVAYLACGPRWFFRVLPAMLRYPIERRAAEVRARTLVIRGEHDDVAPRAWVSDLTDTIEFASLWEIEGAAHSVMHAHADGVAHLVSEFVHDPTDTDDLVNRLTSAAEHDVGHAPRYPDLPSALRGIRARIREGIAVARRDDDAIAAAKTAHARAMSR